MDSNKKKKIIIISAIVAAVLVILTVVGVILYHKFQDYMERKSELLNTNEYTNENYQTRPTWENNTEPLTGEEALWPVVEHLEKVDKNGLDLICNTDDVLNVLLIGTDARYNETARSDSMILVSLNSKTHKIVMTSFMRDMLVNIPGKWEDRLNAAMSYGGPELLFQTLEENFNVSVDYYALVNFHSFVDVVEAMGGLDLELLGPEITTINHYLDELNVIFSRPHGTDYVKASDVMDNGKFHLNGYQVLSYARNRYTSTASGQGADFGRTERQRIVLEEMIEKAKSLSFSEIDHLLDVTFPLVQTNLPKDLIKSLARNALVYLFYDLESSSVPQTGMFSYATYKGMSILQVDFKKINQYVYEQVYGEPAPSTTK